MKKSREIKASPACLTPAEAAQQLRIGRAKMYDLLRSGEIPSVRVGRKIVIPAAELSDWLQRKARSATTHAKGGAVSAS